MSQRTPFRRRSAAFHRRHKGAAALVWLSSLSVFALIGLASASGGAVAMGVAPAVLTAAAVCHRLSRYETALEARMATPARGPVWQVHVNGLYIGDMADADHAALCHSVFCDARVYRAQLFNLLEMALGGADCVLKVIPLCLFWVAIGSFFFAPEAFATALTTLQTVRPEQLVAAIPLLAQIVILLFLMALGVHAAIGHPLCFVNQFKQAFYGRVRRAMKCAAAGDVSVLRLDAPANSPWRSQ